ncbi:bidirectional sugar transporter SWEET17-like isoform X2 [Humulus lupulus]|uniref:bidirectional sugar transporter SWEET17-like isoform X2 n=1 Tax=Humulus lupulus TaxID=3486 RepID=UPI002B4044E4|nr:bidirectional sugar transporter SWEET17-like isoform X2 [Humulus lupulus]
MEGTIISVLMFLSPARTFWRIVKHGSTEDFESLPYICTLLSSLLWTYYGLTKSGEVVVAIVNGFGSLVEIIYVSLFLIYAHPKMRAKTGILVGILDVGFFGVAILVTQLAMDKDARINAMGFLGAGLNIIMYGSPLAAMKTVVTRKSVEYMPFLLSFFQFLNGGIWTLYAILVQDYFLMVPNGIGFMLGIAQLVLYAIYRNSKPCINKIVVSDSDALLEQGCQSERLITSSSSSH